MIHQVITKLVINSFEKYYERRLEKSDKEIVFSGNGGAIFCILLFGSCLGLFIYLGVEKITDTVDWIVLAIAGLVLAWFVLFSCTFLGSKIILNPRSITLKGPVKTFGDSSRNRQKTRFREILAVNRSVEMLWNEIEKIERSDAGLYFYTTSGHRYFLNIAFFDMKLVPRIKSYKDVQKMAGFLDSPMNS